MRHDVELAEDTWQLLSQAARRLAKSEAELLQAAVANYLAQDTAATRVPSLPRLQEIARMCAALPVLDPRPADEILAYDKRGLPA